MILFSADERGELRIEISMEGRDARFSLNNQFHGLEDVQKALQRFVTFDSQTTVKLILDPQVPIATWLACRSMIKEIGLHNVKSYLVRESGGNKTFTELSVGAEAQDKTPTFPVSPIAPPNKHQ